MRIVMGTDGHPKMARTNLDSPPKGDPVRPAAPARGPAVERRRAADASADPEIVACDLVSQAEHGLDSPAGHPLKSIIADRRRGIQ